MAIELKPTSHDALKHVVRPRLDEGRLRNSARVSAAMPPPRSDEGRPAEVQKLNIFLQNAFIACIIDSNAIKFASSTSIMRDLLANFNLRVNEEIYLKDPASSSLGQRILTGSIDLIDEIGFENFTFRKLAKSISSTEASAYRYFENKHKLLLYMTSWYWAWMEYRMVFALANVPSPVVRLERALDLLTERVQEDNNYTFIDEVKLNRIVISESSKAYLTKEVDEENAAGVFAGYKQLVQRVCDVILEINPGYKYPHMLVSTAIEGAHHQRFFAEHLPRLTDFVQGEDAIQEFTKEMVRKSIGLS